MKKKADTFGYLGEVLGFLIKKLFKKGILDANDLEVIEKIGTRYLSENTDKSPENVQKGTK